MKLCFPFVLISLQSAVLRNNRANAVSSEREMQEKYLIEAGCKRKMIDYDSGNWTGEWWAFGELLEKGACISYYYQTHAVPEKGLTKVYSTIDDLKLRAVDAKHETVSIDFTLTMQWMDPSIKTNFSQEDNENGGIVLDTKASVDIWQPDLYIYNLSNYKYYSGSKQIKSLKIMARNELNQGGNTKDSTTRDQKTKTLVKLTMEAKTSIYCDFDLSTYPMDKQICNFRFGSRSSGATFMLYDPNKIYHNTTRNRAVNFDMTVTFFDKNVDSGKNTVGFDIQIIRILRPFIMKYYVPCMGIVLVSQLSFVIPPSPGLFPGRVVLLVTQFLTLTSLFIHQMSESPSETDVDALGLYLLCSLSFVVGALIEFSIVVLLNRVRSNKIVVAGSEIEDNKPTYRGVNISTQRDWFKNDAVANPKRQLSIDFIDFGAFWIFLILFLFFNLLYWVSHLNQ